MGSLAGHPVCWLPADYELPVHPGPALVGVHAHSCRPVGYPRPVRPPALAGLTRPNQSGIRAYERKVDGWASWRLPPWPPGRAFLLLDDLVLLSSPLRRDT